MPNNSTPILFPLDAIQTDYNTGDAIAFTLQGFDFDGDSLIFSANGLPAGAILDSITGNFNWIPILGQEGAYNISFAVSDGIDSNTLPLILNISPKPAINNAPVLDAIGDKFVAAGSNLNFIVSASDADGDALSFVAENLPEGAVFNAGTGEFNWIPLISQVGNYVAGFTVTDGILNDFQNVNIEVTDAPNNNTGSGENGNGNDNKGKKGREKTKDNKGREIKIEKKKFKTERIKIKEESKFDKQLIKFNEKKFKFREKKYSV